MDDFDSFEAPSFRKRRSRKEKAAGDNSAKVLRSSVDQIIQLEERKRALGADIKAVYAAAKDAGFNPRAVKIVVKREMEEDDERAAREAAELEAADLMARLGDFATSPLGEAAVMRAH